jgi:glycogen debranching enzyme
VNATAQKRSPTNDDLDAADLDRPLRLYALKHVDTFVVADAHGDIHGRDDGVFRDDTRVLSRWILRVGGTQPSLLAADVSRDNVYFTAHLTNRALPELGDRSTPRGIVHVARTRFVFDGRVHERVDLHNFGGRGVRVPVAFHFASDFSDIFEVRGMRRERRGRELAPQVAADGVQLRYAGLDSVTRACAITFHPPPQALSDDRAEYDIALADRGRATIYVDIGPAPAGDVGEPRFRALAARARRAMRSTRRRGASIECSGELFGVWLSKSRADLALLTTELSTGPYPYAGIPWFATTFGRDGIVTALQMLWIDPSIARGVLSFLAAHQADAPSAFSDAGAGKVLHETRKGEMAVLGEVPFARYFGGVDQTPLFVMLAGAYAQRTGDLELIERLWPSLVAAMGWIEDASIDGLLAYRRGAATGLANQGWKDSADSVFHADGSMALSPIALVEVQGYVHAACIAMAALAGMRRDTASAQRWSARAEDIRRRVEALFWMEDEGFYGIALDAQRALCRVCASNAGHLLFTGLPSRDRAEKVMERLAGAPFDSGFGMRTLGRDQANFNPMSYHNGSVWPHDTAICAAGFARYGNKQAAAHWLDELFRAASHFGMRMPELHCGFARRPGEPPIAYPVACLPQAWSAGAVFMVLQACLGLTIDAVSREVRIDRPTLPRELERLAVRKLAVGTSSIDLVFQRAAGRVVASAERAPDDVRIVMTL